ncbi:ricin-type beta-trefoil lectin domain protein [Streptacidiphilus sp. N1-12]|uniref:Ricin-type beta-trefoil lectin domain protein n=2 Tax=Streptacidiphilus alkalitolerans TaxID=3342712 RepID=A0ABV6WN32_9ACTN
MQRLRVALATAAVAVATLVATVTFAVPDSTAAVAPAATSPTAAQLLAQTQTCTPASNGDYATDEGAAATIPICKKGSAYFWTSDMDIDCDGITTSHCSNSTDPTYFDETSFQTSTGQFFTSDVTHYYVIPLPSSRFNYQSAGITPGSVAAVIYNNKLVYAVFADEGPDDIIGEGSYSLAVALGIDPDPATGGTEGPVTFIVFPGHVPSPVENNSAIDSAGASAAGSWLGSGGTTSPPPTSPPPPTGGVGQITGYGGKCVDLAGASSANGTAVQLYTCNGTGAQSWTVESNSTLQALGKCMDVTAAGTANGSKVQLYACNGTGSQVWQHQANGELVNPQSGKCLDATGPSSANGTRLQIWTCSDGANQQWNLPA